MNIVSNLLILVFFFPTLCFSQNTLRDSVFKIYDFYSLIEKNSYYEKEQAFAICGNYKKAIEVDEEVLTCRYIFDSTIKVTKSDIAAINALDLIEARSKQTNVLIINEAHNKPMHRAFIRELVRRLHGKYSIYASETLLNINKQIYSNKYPVFFHEYTFINEPSYSNIIRTALESKYRLKTYENTNNKCYNITYNDSMVHITNTCLENFKRIELKVKNFDPETRRELVQALNLLNIIQKNPESKIIVHCGYGHSSRYEKMMGYYLSQLGINFLSINQTYFNEQYTCSNYLKEYKDNKHLSYAYCLVTKKDSSSNIYNKKFSGREDIFVFHPPTKFFGNRPHWLLNKFNDTCWHQDDFIDYKCPPYKVLVYRQEEFEKLKYKAIPSDIIEITDRFDQKSVILDKGVSYSIVIRDFKNNIKVINMKNGNTIR